MSSKHSSATTADDQQKRRKSNVTAPASGEGPVQPTKVTAGVTSTPPPTSAATASSTAIVKPAEDVYASTVRAEELESRERTTAVDSDLFHQQCVDFRSLLADILQLKLKSAASSPSASVAAELADKRIDGAHQLVVMKKLNRLDKIRLRSGRDALHREKQTVDSNHLQLQNLLYEAEHLRKEVQRCFQFKSHDDDIQLVPEEQFYAEAPPEVSRPERTRDDEHARRLARLEWELQQRKELAAMCTELQRQKELAAEHIATRTERLESLVPGLDALLKATRPLQVALCMPVEATWKVNRVARLLPPPLYMAYANLNAYAEACDTLLVAKINGDESDVLDDVDDDDGLDDMVATAAVTSSSMKDDDAHDDEAMESDGEENNAGRRHHRRHHVASPPSIEADAPAKLKPAKVPQSIEAQLERLLRAHPLSVTFEVRAGNAGTGDAATDATLNVTLRYLSALNLVTVTCNTSVAGDEAILAAGSLLSALQPGDIGTQSPNPRTFYQLRALGIEPERFAALLAGKRLGQPYGWAQRLCGLDVSSVTTDEADASAQTIAPPQLDVTQVAVPQVVARLRQRWQARLKLCEHVRTLAAGVRTTAAAPNGAALQRWQPIGWAEYCAHEAAVQRFVKARVASERDSFYAVTIARGTVARFECAVRVSVEHPRQLPMWALSFRCGEAVGTALTNTVVREIECWVNSVEAADVKAADGGNVLATQLERAQSSLDIYLETDGVAGASPMVREKTFLRAFRGRTRSRPLRAMETSVGSVIYTQV